MSRDMIIEKLEQAKYYAEQALHRAEDAREQASEAETQALEAYDAIRGAIKMHEEKEDD